MRPLALSLHSGPHLLDHHGQARTGVGPEWGRARSCHVPGVVGVSLILVPGVHPEMRSSITITCPTCGYCTHKPICPLRTQSQQPCLWLPQSKPSSMVSPSAHPHLDEATPRWCKHPNLPLRGLIPSPSGVSDQPRAYRSPRSKRVDSASLTFLASTHVSLSPWQPLCSRPRQPSHGHQRQPPHRPACCYSAHPRPQSILNMAAKGNL